MFQFVTQGLDAFTHSVTEKLTMTTFEIEAVII